jgi:hypothetical protein
MSKMVYAYSFYFSRFFSSCFAFFLGIELSINFSVFFIGYVASNYRAKRTAKIN